MSPLDGVATTTSTSQRRGPSTIAQAHEVEHEGLRSTSLASKLKGYSLPSKGTEKSGEPPSKT